MADRSRSSSRCTTRARVLSSSIYAAAETIQIRSFGKALQGRVAHPAGRRRQPGARVQGGRSNAALRREGARGAHRGRRRQQLHRLRDVVGSAHPRARAEGAAEGARRGRRQRHELRRAHRARDAAGAARRDADAVDGAGALRQLRHRGGDERGARRPRGDQARQDPQVRRLLSRARRRVPRAGGLRRDDARRADEPRRRRRRRARHARRALQRPRVGRGHLRPEPRPDRRGLRRADCRQHGARPAAGRAFSRGCARCAIASTRSSSSTR